MRATQAGAAAGWFFRAPTPVELASTSFAISVDGLASTGYAHRAVISPNGRLVAYVAQNKIWVRDLASEQPRALEGTENDVGPFWSPDSTQIGFAAGNELKKVPASGGAPFVLAKLEGVYRGGAWSLDGGSVVACNPSGQIFEVPAADGLPKQVYSSDSGTVYSIKRDRIADSS